MPTIFFISESKVLALLAFSMPTFTVVSCISYFGKLSHLASSKRRLARLIFIVYHSPYPKRCRCLNCGREFVGARVSIAKTMDVHAVNSYEIGVLRSSLLVDLNHNPPHPDQYYNI